MDYFFSRSQRALQADDSHQSILGIFVAVGIIGLWILWFLFGKITLYEVSVKAQIRIDRKPIFLDAPVRGRILASHLTSGQRVREGEVLLELETFERKVMVKEKQDNLAVLSYQLNTLRKELLIKRKSQGKKSSIEEIKQKMSLLKEMIASEIKDIEKFNREIEKSHLVSPISGQIERVSALPLGALVEEGQRIGEIVPPAEKIIIAFFPLSRTSGTVQPGQRARFRCYDNAWIQYGYIPAKVVNISKEEEHHQLKVVLTIDGDRAPFLYLGEGIQGEVEIAVGHLTPASLILRAAGKVSGATRGRNGV